MALGRALDPGGSSRRDPCFSSGLIWSLSQTVTDSSAAEFLLARCPPKTLLYLRLDRLRQQRTRAFTRHLGQRVANLVRHRWILQTKNVIVAHGYSDERLVKAENLLKWPR